MQDLTGREIEAFNDQELDEITSKSNMGRAKNTQTESNFDIKNGDYSTCSSYATPKLVIAEITPECCPDNIKAHYFSSKGESKRPPNILKNFIDIPKKSHKRGKVPIVRQREEPKKEYFRIKLIRGHKRALRFVFLKEGFPKTTINKVNKNNQNQIDAWNIFQIFSLQNFDKLKTVSKTDNGPLTDGEANNIKRYGKNYKDVIKGEKTFNNKFCDEYFADQAVSMSFVYYSDVIFSNSIEELCAKFNFRCCVGTLYHNDQCKEKWESLSYYCKTQLVHIDDEIQENNEDIEMCDDEKYIIGNEDENKVEMEIEKSKKV
ncbi:hypothetical protein SteCoe_9586 [Stentor coeruleus]|uniref:Uncharacterized protein n=1 Tax=Stentor coeruleus TaxID=5963 RepID=A0A1R2CHI6_9CILI|nr:hypothetical protein SteCoe_9586 [Stentor coeruleus]